MERFRELAPAAAAALASLGKAAEEGGLDKALIELVKIRVAQINRCAFCIQHHLGIARKLGIEAVKLDLLPAWREAGAFSAREQAALAWAEHLTAAGAGEAPDPAAQFDESEIVSLTVAIAQINAWNRIAGGLAFPLRG